MSDPRFDPRFQRGYSGPQPVPSAPRRVAPESDLAPDPQHPLVGVPPAPTAPPASEIAENSEVPDFAGAEELDAATARRNPYALALLIAGVVLLVIGVAIIWSTATFIDNSTAFDVQDQIFSMLSFLLPPALFTGGLFGIVGWLVLGALGARTSRGR